MKFPTTINDIEDLIDLLQSLDGEDKLYLATEAFQCDDRTTDKHGQIILQTRLQWVDDEVKEMTDEDFKEKLDGLDL